MRLRNALALAALTTAAAVPVAHALTPVPVPAMAAPPACGAESTADFPLTARIQDGPVEYAAGGEFLTWNLDLTNTTDRACGGIHPVLVLTDRGRTLRPAQIRAEFYDAGARLWRPVTFEGTDRAENVGVFGGGGNAPSRRPDSAERPDSADQPDSADRPDSPDRPDSADRAAPADPRPSASTDPAHPTAPTAPIAPVAPADPHPSASASASVSAPRPFAGFAVPPRRTLTVPVRLAFRADTAPDEVVVNAAVVQRMGEDGDWVGESGDYTLSIGPADPDAEPRTDPATPPADPARPTPPGADRTPGGLELAHTGREDALRLVAPASAALLAAGAALVLLTRRHRGPRSHRHV
ncbi:hypothetical protein ACH414_06825 [Streptomyces sp. NPDC020422]|uniref:hypothetical protein n=1 Tax=Streptomyces sp. NPDC020422 TaxID=3365074 RepID=UPI0037ABB29D